MDQLPQMWRAGAINVLNINRYIYISTLIEVEVSTNNVIIIISMFLHVCSSKLLLFKLFNFSVTIVICYNV